MCDWLAINWTQISPASDEIVIWNSAIGNLSSHVCSITTNTLSYLTNYKKRFSLYLLILLFSFTSTFGLLLKPLKVDAVFRLYGLSVERYHH